MKKIDNKIIGEDFAEKFPCWFVPVNSLGEYNVLKIYLEDNGWSNKLIGKKLKFKHLSIKVPFDKTQKITVGKIYGYVFGMSLSLSGRAYRNVSEFICEREEDKNTVNSKKLK